MEKPNAKGSNNFVVGLFVFVSLLVAAGFVVFMGGTARFASEIEYRTSFKDVRGLNVGAPVYMSGIQVGHVSGFELPASAKSDSVEGAKVITVIAVEARYGDRVRKNSEASITTMGMLGDKVVTVSPGFADAAVLAPHEFVNAAPVKELSDYFSRGGNLVEELNKLAMNLNGLVEDLNGEHRIGRILENLDRTSSNFSQLASKTNERLDPALKSLQSVLAKIDAGKGTLGALVNDPSLHEDMRILLGGAKRSQMIRFLVREAIKNNDEATEKTPAKK